MISKLLATEETGKLAEIAATKGDNSNSSPQLMERREISS